MAKGRPRKFDKEEALITAMKLFWKHGYEGVSVSQLADAIGINIPSLYAAFGNKEQLFMAAFEKYGILNGHMYQDSLKEKKARDVAYKILLGEVELVTRDGSPNGCLSVMGALVTGSDSEHISKMMDEARRTPPIWMTERFKQAIEEGDLPPNADPATLSCYIMSLNLGIAVQAKSGVEKAELLKVVDMAMKNWPFTD